MWRMMMTLLVLSGLCLLSAGDLSACPGGVVSNASLSSYVACSWVQGNLVLTGASLGNLSSHDLDALSDIEVIDGYLLVSRTNLTDLRFFHNLRVVYGTEAIFYRKGRYTLIVEYNDLLKTYNFASIQLIAGGGVMSVSNPSLCFLNNDFNRYIEIDYYSNLIDSSPQANCTGLECYTGCFNGWCWGPEPDECSSCTAYVDSGVCVTQCNESISHPNKITRQCIFNVPPPLMHLTPTSSVTSCWESGYTHLPTTPYQALTSYPSEAIFVPTSSSEASLLVSPTSPSIQQSPDPSPVPTTTTITVDSNIPSVITPTLSVSLTVLALAAIIVSAMVGYICGKKSKPGNQVHPTYEYRPLKRWPRHSTDMSIAKLSQLWSQPSSLPPVDGTPECQSHRASEEVVSDNVGASLQAIPAVTVPSLATTVTCPPFLPMQLDQIGNEVKDVEENDHFLPGLNASRRPTSSNYPNVYSTDAKDTLHKSTPSSRATSPHHPIATSSHRLASFDINS